MLTLMLLAGAQAACPEPRDAQELLNALGSAEAAFVGLDSASFRTAMEEARSILPCVNAPLSPLEAAEYHQAEAYEAFLRRSNDEVVRRFAAMQHSMPSAVLPESVAPPGHPLRVSWSAAALMLPPQTEPVPAPQDAALFIDGVVKRERPVNLPLIAQLVSDEGVVLWTVALDPGEPLPEYPRELFADPAPVARKPVGLVVGASGAALTAVVLGGLAGASARSFADLDTPYDELGGLRKQTNGLIVGSATAGAAALGLGAVAVIRW